MGGGASTSVKTNMAAITNIAAEQIMNSSTTQTIEISADMGIGTTGDSNVYDGVNMQQEVRVVIKFVLSEAQIADLQTDVAGAMSAVASATSAQSSILGISGDTNVEQNQLILTNVKNTLTSNFIKEIEEKINAKQFITTVGDSNVYSNIAMTQLVQYAGDTIAESLSKTSAFATIATSMSAEGTSEQRATADTIGDAVSNMIDSAGNALSGIIGAATVGPVMMFMGIVVLAVLGFFFMPKLMSSLSPFGGKTKKAEKAEKTENAEKTEKTKNAEK